MATGMPSARAVPSAARRVGLAGLAAALLLLAGCRSEMYEQPRYEPLEPSSFFEDGTLVAAAGRRHGRPRGRPRRAAEGAAEDVFYSGWDRGPARRDRPVPGGSRGARARPGALPDLLRPLPRRVGRRPRHDRPPRLQPAAAVLQRRAAPAADRPLLRRDDPRLRDHVLVRDAGPAPRPLGDRRVHPGAPAQPARRRPPSCPRRTAGSSRPRIRARARRTQP